MHHGDPQLAQRLAGRLRLPVMAGPMFIASTAALLLEQCRAGIVGSVPALNFRSTAALEAAVAQIGRTLNEEAVAAPYAVNLVAHPTNDRLKPDLDVLVAHRVPIVIVSLAAPTEIVEAIHAYGGLVFNDVISDRHARKCAAAGVDGLIAVAAGAGGHTGNLSPFALVQEIRGWWQGPLALAGCIATGRSVVGALAMGADFAYIGSPFLACAEANTSAEFKSMVVEAGAADIVVTDCFTGVPATFLRPSLEANGIDPASLKRGSGQSISIKDGGSNSKAWRDIWSAGQGIGPIDRSLPARAYVDRLAAEFDQARGALAGALALSAEGRT